MKSQRLIVGVDIRDLKIAKTGTKTYLEELCIEFKELENDTTKFVFFDTSFNVYTGENKFKKLVEHFNYQLWKQVILPFKAMLNRCDILFCTDNYVPLLQLGFKTIPVIHDAFFFENPEHFNKMWLWIFKVIGLPAIKNSPIVITTSNYAKQRIIHFTDLPSHKVIPVYEAAKSFGSKKVANDNLLERHKIEKRKYILHVGIINKRKNIPILIKALKLLKLDGCKNLKLVLVGNLTKKKHENDYELIKKTITNAELTDEVIFTGYLNTNELKEIYSHALIYVFPSLNEGFGIPILEAFRHKIPVLVADNTSLPEIGGDAVLTFDPYSETDIFNKIKLLIDNPNKAQEMIQKGSERLKLFSWRNTALQLIKIFKETNNKT